MSRVHHYVIGFLCGGLAFGLVLHLLLLPDERPIEKEQQSRLVLQLPFEKKQHSRLVLLLPFIDEQVENKLFSTLDRWSKSSYNPCGADPEQNQELAQSVQIYFYHPGNYSEKWPSIQKKWKQISPHTPCINPDAQLLLGALPISIWKTHPTGPCAQFYSIFTRLKGFAEGIFLIEPDALPIRHAWLPALVYDVAKNICTDFWIKGSAPQCDVKYGEIQARGDMHINGNGIYCVGDNAFDNFLERVKQFFPAGQAPEANFGGCATGQAFEGGYDNAIFQFLHHKSNFNYARTVLPKYQYTDFILNYCEDTYDEKLLREKKPHTYFVHSKGPYFSVTELKIRSTYFETTGGYPHRDILADAVEEYRKDRSSIDKLKSNLCQLQSNAPRLPTPCRRLCMERLQFRNEHSWCGKIQEYIGWLDKVPPQKALIWNNDFHVAPMFCSKDILQSLGATIHAEIDFNNCIWHPPYCKKGLKVLAFDDWRGFSLDPCPNLMKKSFYEAYRDDPEFQRVDLFICSHPAANCELFMPFNRSILVYATTRLEFGRNDKFIDWRQPYIDNRSPHRWREWVQNLKLIAANPRNTIAANSLFDVHYIKYHTGIDAMYLPSWCGSTENNTNPNPNPNHKSSREILVGPYRDNLDFPRFDDAATWKHPIMQGLTAAINTSSTQFTFIRMRKKYERYETSDLVKHPAIVLIPYQVSTMQFFELYRLNIPMYVPSLKLLTSWIRQHGIMWERKYGTPERIPHDFLSAEPNSPNTDEALEYWIGLSDYYQFPHVHTFDSWEQLLQILKVDQFRETQRKMREINNKQHDKIKSQWKSILNKATGANHYNELIQRPYAALLDYDEAMYKTWRKPPLGADPPHKLNAKCRILENDMLGIKTVTGQVASVVADPIAEEVNTMFQRVLGRTMDDSAFMYVAQIRLNILTIDQLRSELCHSDEFRGSQWMESKACQEYCLEKIYKNKMFHCKRVK